MGGGARRVRRHVLVAVALAVTAGCAAPDAASEGAAGSAAAPASPATPTSPVARDRAPVARTYQRAGRMTRMYGASLALGDSARASAEAFVTAHAASFGVRPDELVLVPVGRAKGATDSGASGVRGPGSDAQPLMYDRATGRYRFSLYRYAQHKGGISVFDSELRLVVRNEPPYATVLAVSELKNVRDFGPRVKRRIVDRRKANAAVRALPARTDFKGEALPGADPGLDRFGAPELVVWAGTGDAAVAPRVALTFVADNDGHRHARAEKWRFVVDADTGDVLHLRSLIQYDDVPGNVSGMVTSSAREMRCDPETLTAFPYADVSIQGGNAANTDASGDYTISNPGTTAVTVQSPVTGTRFEVFDGTPARDEVLQQMVVPPAAADFVHNPTAGADEFLTAQANAYANANEVRDWVLAHQPAYPDVASQVRFPVRVNRTDDICPGNAWYDGASLNFCASFDHPSPAKDDYGNTSFRTVAQHEFGHHLVAVAGSGQGEYGEGMGDVVSMLIADNSKLALGFFLNDCTTALRDADNTCQFAASPNCSSCGSEIHDCGMLLSGAVWDLRQALGISDPLNALEIVSDLAVNSILLHTGTAIDPRITIDFLTLDDDDGNIDNGTPHSAEICAAFGSHGLNCPTAPTGLTVSPVADFAATGPLSGPFTPSSSVYTVENLGPGTIDYQASTPAAWLTLVGASGTLTSGATATVTVQINATANTLLRGVHTASVTFANTTNGTGNTTREVALEIGRTVAYSWNFEADPGWTAQGSWAYGTPAGGGGAVGDDNFGNPDPTSGFTGAKVYGYDLAGNYPNRLTAEHLTTTVLNLSQMTNVALKFKRWLCVEESLYDHAYVRVSTNGTTWTDVWQNAYTLNGGDWTTQQIDLSSVANLRPTVYLRWTMGDTDAGWRYCGWNIDDVEVSGIQIGSCVVPGDCDDGLHCNGIETCTGGSCAPGTPVACDDGVACTLDACDENTNACASTPGATACSNSVYCDGDEICDAVMGCKPGVTRDCTDLVGCTTDSCNEGTDSCDHTPNHASCGNGQYCDGAETCHPTLDCLPGTPVACGDAFGCTADSCNEGTDSCDHMPSDAACGNGQYCDGVETCSATLGCQAGTPMACGDGVGCTTDSCNEGTDSCDHTPSDAACANGQYCDGVETCSATLGCEAGTPVACGDAFGCTTDSCNEGTDSCDHTPNDAACGNGQYCDGVETCSATLGCEAGTPVACGDGVGCTTDGCNEGTDSCDHTPSDAACDDGLYCNGVETCDATLDCQSGTTVECGDGVGCTTDGCNEGTDSCDHTPSDAACDDGLYCSGVETCDATLDCQGGTTVDCGDGVGCTTDGCNEGTDACDHTPSDVACDDGVYCNGAETCHATLDCQTSIDPCVGQVCDEGGDRCGSPAVDSGSPASDDDAGVMDAGTSGGGGGAGGTADAATGSPPDAQTPLQLPPSSPGATQGAHAEGGAEVEPPPSTILGAPPDAGCGCRVAGARTDEHAGALALFACGLGLLSVRRRRPRA